MGGAEVVRPENITFLRHGRVSCLDRMAREVVGRRLIAATASSNRILRKCRGGGKQAENKQDLFHGNLSRWRSELRIIRGCCGFKLLTQDRSKACAKRS